jgi:restriction system protein
MARRRKKQDNDTDLAYAIVVVVFVSAFVCTQDFESAIYVSLLVLACVALGVTYFVYARAQKRGGFAPPFNFPAPRRSAPSRSKSRPDSLAKQQRPGPVAVSSQPKYVAPDKWSAALIRSLDWKVYEDLCAGYFKATGRRAEVTTPGADGGIDIHHYRLDKSEKLQGIVQCKAWSKKPIGVREIRELFGVMTDVGCPTGVYLTTSSYTPDAQSFAEGKRIKLVDTDKLLRLISGLPDAAKTALLKQTTFGDYTTPFCPNCGTKLISRLTREGKNIGQGFWGCRNFPKCRYTMRQAS